MEIAAQRHGCGTWAKTARTRESTVDRPRADRLRAGTCTLPADESRPFGGARPEGELRPRLEARRASCTAGDRRGSRDRAGTGSRSLDGHGEGAGAEQDRALRPVGEPCPDDLPAVVDVLPGTDRPAGAVHHERVEVEERRDRLRDAAQVDDDGDLPVLRRVGCIADGLTEAVEPEQLGDGVARQCCDRPRRRTGPDGAERAAVGRAVADDETVGTDRVGDAGGRRSRGRRDLPEVVDASVRPARCMNRSVLRIGLADDHAFVVDAAGEAERAAGEEPQVAHRAVAPFEGAIAVARLRDADDRASGVDREADTDLPAWQRAESPDLSVTPDDGRALTPGKPRDTRDLTPVVDVLGRREVAAGEDAEVRHLPVTPEESMRRAIRAARVARRRRLAR